jgi:hypothetical protein
MESVDQQLRLAKEHYAGMAEGELSALADDAYNLTEIGREALAAVISERGLEFELKTGPPAPSEVLGSCDRLDFDDSELLSYGWAMDEEDLRKMKAWLTRAGTPCFIGPDNVLEPEDYKGSFADGVNVKIRNFDWQRTMSTLASLQKGGAPSWPPPVATLIPTGDQPESDEEPPDNGEEDYEQQVDEVRCPQCNSAEVVFEGRNCEDQINPPPTAKYKWSCSACDNQWQDDGFVTT